MTKSLVQFMSQGSVLIFVTRKQNAEELAHNLKVKAEIDCRYKEVKVVIDRRYGRSRSKSRLLLTAG